MTNILRVVLALVVVMCADVAIARPAKEFDRHVDEAQRYYSEKNYEKAIEEFELAYQLEPDPVLLISVGRCHYLADRPSPALAYYNRALQGKLARSEREEVAASVAKATIKLQEQQQAQAAKQREVDQARLAALVASRPASPSPPEKPIYKKAWFWGTVGGIVIVGLGVGLTVGLLSRNNTPEMPAAAMTPAYGVTAF